MRLSLVVIFTVSLVSAASVVKRWNDDYGIPSCAKFCYENVDPYPCTHDDKDKICRCLNRSYGAWLRECIDSYCDDEDTKKAAEAGIKYCKAAGVDPESPFPKCGVHCLEGNPNDKCGLDDDACLCQDKEYLEKVIWCFKDSCKGEDFETAKCVGEGYCKAVGVDISYIFGY